MIQTPKLHRRLTIAFLGMVLFWGAILILAIQPRQYTSSITLASGATPDSLVFTVPAVQALNPESTAEAPHQVLSPESTAEAPHQVLSPESTAEAPN